jgi:hypothetical protein
MNSKSLPLVLAIFTLVCALPAAGAIPAAIAQQEDTSLGAGLARGIVSDVLDGGGDDEQENGDAADDAETDDQDSTDTATVNPNQEYNNEANFAPQNNNPVAIPIIDQDQEAANLAAQLGANIDLDAANVDVNEEEEVPLECQEGFAPENGQCRSTETTEPICPTGSTPAPEGDRCVVGTPGDRTLQCPTGSTPAPEGDRCVVGTPVDRTPECPPGTEPIPGSDQCGVLADRTLQCPPGTEPIPGSDQCGVLIDKECPPEFALEANGDCRSTETTEPV